jgi:ABC-2 type transport system ATP-binding protein
MIEIKNVTKIYGRERAVDNLSLSIDKGEAFGFLGQNGSGKTTTIKMIVGLVMPTEGSIFIAGRPSWDISIKEKIGFMPEAPYFYDRLTGLEFLKFCGELFKQKRKSDEEYGEILRLVGIYEARNKKIEAYSKGMKQRLGFAQTIVNDPDYIFLDEPLDGLDPLGRKEVKEIVKRLRAAGKTIFFNSHILYDTEELCDKIGIIHKGRLLWTGPVKEFCQGEPLEKKFVELVEKYQ